MSMAGVAERRAAEGSQFQDHPLSFNNVSTPYSNLNNGITP